METPLTRDAAPRLPERFINHRRLDFPGCHQILKQIHYKGWICVDLDIARNSPKASYQRCGKYIVNKLEPIYA